jgi:hypothetical protein
MTFQELNKYQYKSQIELCIENNKMHTLSNPVEIEICKIRTSKENKEKIQVAVGQDDIYDFFPIYYENINEFKIILIEPAIKILFLHVYRVFSNIYPVYLFGTLYKLNEL